MKKISKNNIFSTLKNKVKKINYQSFSKKINRDSFKNINLFSIKNKIKDRFILIEPKLILQNIQDKIEKLSIKEEKNVRTSCSSAWFVSG